MFSEIYWQNRSRAKKKKGYKNWSVLTNELLPNLLRDIDDQIFNIFIYLESPEMLTAQLSWVTP